jgi:hypothetical protein
MAYLAVTSRIVGPHAGDVKQTLRNRDVGIARHVDGIALQDHERCRCGDWLTCLEKGGRVRVSVE